MVTPHQLFKTKIDAFLAKVPADRRADAELDLKRALDASASGPDAAAVGRVFGPQLKALEKKYVEAEEAAPSLSQGDKLLELLKAGVLDPFLMAEFSAHAGQPGYGKALEASYGQLVKTREGCVDKTLLVGAYTQIRGYLFEQSRIAIARSMGGNAPAASKKVRVTFRGLAAPSALNGFKPEVTTYRNIAIDNDVPLIPGRIWETKWYPRKNFGSDHNAVNQLLKYQQAVDDKYFDAVTIEIAGNIDPTFLAAVCEGREVAPGLELFVPDVELIFALNEQTSVTLKPSRNAKSLARSNDKARGIAVAVSDRRYDLFTNKMVVVDDLVEAEVPFREHLISCIRGKGFVDPERIERVGAMRTYEEIVERKRKKAWGL